MKREESIQLAVCNYLRMQYPHLIWTCDLASGMKLTMGQAVKAKQMRSSRAYPDLFIAQPSIAELRSWRTYHGLYIELKVASPYLKDGITLLSDWKTDKRTGERTSHLREQAEMLTRLNSIGYMAVFAVGFDQAKLTIDTYLRLPSGNPDE